MKRRAFFALMGGAIAWPLAARAQQTAMPVVGLLDQRSPDELADRLRGFRQGLRDAGFAEGQNLAIDYRWAENKIERLPELAVDLIRRQVAVIAATSGVSPALAAKAATTTIPVVFIVSDDPVRLGLVASLARPGGNLTGVNFYSTELAAKRLELLRELLPTATRVAVLIDPANTEYTETTVREVGTAARIIGLQIQVVKASTIREINAAFATFVQERPDALFVGHDPFFNSRRTQLVHLATRYAVPASYSARDFAEAGGLMSYGANIADAWRQAGFLAKSSRAPSLRTCRLCSRASSSWSLTRRLPLCSASRCRRSCSLRPTRSSSKRCVFAAPAQVCNCALCRFSAAGDCRTFRTLWRPAVEKRQGTKSRRRVVRRQCRRLWEFSCGVRMEKGCAARPQQVIC
jgi:putative ABC transport system substrate-binding protein